MYDMDTILLTVTGISLALAATMGVLLARMLREERRRSDARVAMLSEMAAEPEQGPSYAEIEVQPAHSQRVSTPPRREPQRVSFNPQGEPRRVSMRPERDLVTQPTRTLGFDDFELRPSTADVPGVHDLFHEQEEPSPWPRRLAVVGGLAAVIALIVFGWSNPPLGHAGAPAASGQAAEVAVDAPLELLSLRHAQEEGALTITGLVQNPRAGRELSGVKATVFLFGPNGSFIASGRAPIDFTALGPGDESPFLIRVPVTGSVTSYRVGFRGDDDRVLAHVDRRTPDAVAQK